MKVKRILPFRMRDGGTIVLWINAGPVTNVPATASSLDVCLIRASGSIYRKLLYLRRVTHRDSLGVEQIIRPGEVNWMTAGHWHFPFGKI